MPAVRCQSILPPYSSSYTLVTIGRPAGVPNPFGGIAFLNWSTMLVGGGADGSYGAIYQVPVLRDLTTGHIKRLGTAALPASAPYLDGGIALGPGDVLFVPTYPSNTLLEYLPGSTIPDQTVDLTPLGVSGSVGAFQFVPAGLPGAGVFKILSYTAGQWYDATLTPNGSGTYDVSSVTPTVNTGSNPEGMIYIPPGSSQFSAPSVLVNDNNSGDVYVYPTDSDGNPVGAGSIFLSGLQLVMGSAIDPITGDILFSNETIDSGIAGVQGFASGTLTASSGTAQSAMVAGAFANVLAVTLTDPFGVPVGGVTVKFHVKPNGATATLAPTSAVTDASGVATVSATASSKPGTYNVTATLYELAPASFSLTNVALSSLMLSPDSIVGGDSTSANTVTLSSAAPEGGAAIALTSSDPSVAAVPASVTVAGGSTVSAPFTITTYQVGVTTPVTVSASDGTNTKAKTLTVRAILPAAVELSPESVLGGASTTNNTVTLNNPAPSGGATVALLSGNPAVAGVPASVTVAAGATSSPAFTITTAAVATQTAVAISGSYNGATKTATLTVNAAKLVSLKLSPTSVEGGHPTTHNTITLNGPAPAGGAVVTLTSGDSSVATPPASVTVAAGATSATFKIATRRVRTDMAVPITATYGGVAKTATLTVTP
jgi:hypothetical protein